MISIQYLSYSWFSTRIKNYVKTMCQKLPLKRHVFAAHFSPAGRRGRGAGVLNGFRDENLLKNVIWASAVRRRKVSGKNVTIVVLDRTQIGSKCKYMFSMKWNKYLIL